jgi:hypothetical protein
MIRSKASKKKENPGDDCTSVGFFSHWFLNIWKTKRLGKKRKSKKCPNIIANLRQIQKTNLPKKNLQKGRPSHLKKRLATNNADMKKQLRDQLAYLLAQYRPMIPQRTNIGPAGSDAAHTPKRVKP